MSNSNKILFAGGTLRCEDILKTVVGDCSEVIDATLRDYRCLKVKDEVYPGLVAWPGYVISGVLYSGISESGWRRLDAFEGEMYVRVSVMVVAHNDRTFKADTYAVKEKYQSGLQEDDWDFEAFCLRYKSRFLQEYQGFSLLN